MNQTLVPCTSEQDSACGPCPSSLPMNQEYFMPGSCLSRCIAGYAMVITTSSFCKACSSVHCSAGFQLSSQCQDPLERLQLPTCVPCPAVDSPLDRPSPGRVFTGPGCITSCTTGWMQESNTNQTCIPCEPQRCTNLGYRGVCLNGFLTCNTPCSPNPLPIGQTYASPGNCTIICAQGYYFDTVLHACILSHSSSSSSTAKDTVETPSSPMMFGVNLSAFQNSLVVNGSNSSDFPVRTLPHS